VAAADGDAHARYLTVDRGILRAVEGDLDFVIKRVVLNVVLVAGVYGLALVERSAVDRDRE